MLPMALVAYITTMFSADIRYGLNKAKLLSETDGLTGLYNHRHFHERLTLEVERSQRSGLPLSLLMLDVDHFKQFNDSFGHDGGDAVLCALGEFLKKHVRGSEVGETIGLRPDLSGLGCGVPCIRWASTTSRFPAGRNRRYPGSSIHREHSCVTTRFASSFTRTRASRSPP